MAEKNIILQANNVKKYFPITSSFLKRHIGNVYAVDDVSVFVREGETFGLVGESGCGKTTLGRTVLRAIEPTGGTCEFRRKDGSVVDVFKLNSQQLRETRRDMQMIFQDPYASLDPRMIIRDIVGEPLVYNSNLSRNEITERVKDLMAQVGLDPRHLERYPHAFSGGQRQRVGIARALATEPKFIVCDEAVSALDVSVQAQVINLLIKLQQQLNLSYMFISHDLSVVHHISDRVGVMYVGKIVELAPCEELFARPLHPYTEALLSAKPIADPRIRAEKILLEGEIPNPAAPPKGCYFHPRCRYCKDVCKEQTPEYREISTGHFVACHRAEELTLRSIYASAGVQSAPGGSPEC
ncbi:MAG: ABC transporter ATP-binding protein [Christensenellales bacterium]|jgi:peptide/nickel transport system ATP-binding protein